ncbi:unnamed protein product [Urochloa humidicola]
MHLVFFFGTVYAFDVGLSTFQGTAINRESNNYCSLTAGSLRLIHTELSLRGRRLEFRVMLMSMMWLCIWDMEAMLSCNQVEVTANGIAPISCQGNSSTIWISLVSH